MTMGRFWGEHKAKLLVATGVIVVLAGGYTAWHIFGSGGDQTKDNQQTVDRVTSEVSKLFVVPSGQPTVALIQDKNKLSGQQFYNNAQNGDYLIVYADAKLALLYREKINKLINVGPINIGDASQN